MPPVPNTFPSDANATLAEGEVVPSKDPVGSSPEAAKANEPEPGLVGYSSPAPPVPSTADESMLPVPVTLPSNDPVESVGADLTEGSVTVSPTTRR